MRKEAQQRQRERTREKQHKKKNRYSDSEEQDELDDFIVDEDQDNDWHGQLLKITRRDFRDPKFKKLDREKIEQSSSNRIFTQEKYSAYVGKKDEEEDMKKQLQLLKKKKNRD